MGCLSRKSCRFSQYPISTDVALQHGQLTTWHFDKKGAISISTTLLNKKKKRETKKEKIPFTKKEQ